MPAEAEQPTTGQDQTPDIAPEVQVPEAPVAQGSGGPWQSDLDATFQDPSVKAQVDEFLRSTVQPHVTKLEQSQAETKIASELYSDLQERPGETFLAITSELFGDDLAEKVRSTVVGYYDQDEETDDESVTEEPTGKLDPRVEALLQERDEAKRMEAYTKELDQLVEATKDAEVPVVAKWFHPFVAAADGDFQAAYAGYKEWYGEVKQSFVPSNETEGQTETDTPPATLGGEVRAPVTPPTEKKYTSIDEALDDFIAEVKSGTAPTTVGSV